MLSALDTGRLYGSGEIAGTHFYQRLSRPHDHRVAGKIKSIKNLNDLIGNRTRDLPYCIAVPQPTTPLEMVCKVLGHALHSKHTHTHTHTHTPPWT